MARIGGKRLSITPAFKLEDVEKIALKFTEDQEQKILAILFKIGEDFVDKARINGEYMNWTNNLRSSVGYAVYKDGRRLQGNFLPSGDGTLGSGAEGMKQGSAFADLVAVRYLGVKGYVLIGVAGMEYAAYVERTDHDVITGSAPTEAEVAREFEKILKTESETNKGNEKQQ